MIVPMTVDTYLDELDYEFKGYMPKKEALMFVDFIQKLNAGGEENETPLVHLKMMDTVFNKEHRVAVLCHRGIGKLGTPNSLVLTPSGWTTMEKISVGDEIITRNGIAAKIDYKTPLQDPDIYEVELSDGTTFEVGDEHNHIVWMYRKKSREKVLTTLQLLEKPLFTSTSKRKDVSSPKGQYTYSIPLVEPIQYSHKILDISPYVMGYGLANGYFKKSSFTCHDDDRIEIENNIMLSGYDIINSKNTIGSTGYINISGHVFSQYQDLKSRDKFIPIEYTLGSIQQRLELLRGLMDGDGHIAKNGNCSYSSYSKQLSYDVRDLARSLGAISYVKEYKNKHDIEYRTIINIKLNPFKLIRKASKWSPTKKTSRAIVAIRKVENKGGYCIHVDDETHSYITDGFTVTHNTALFAEYLVLFIACYGFMPGFGKVDLMLYISDSIENGVKNLRRNVEFRYANSDFVQKLIPNRKISVGYRDENDNMLGWVDGDEYEASKGGRKFTDIRLEFENARGDKLVVKGYGAKCQRLDARLYVQDGYTTIGEVSVGDEIFGPDGKLTEVTYKSPIQNKDMYRINLKDGREIDVTHDHINSVLLKENYNNKSTFSRKNIETDDLLKMNLVHSRIRKRKGKSDYVSNEDLIFIENIKPLEYAEKELPVDPYTLGLLLGDGSMRKDGSNVLHAHVSDMEYYRDYIPYEFGKSYIDKRNHNVVSVSIKKISKEIRKLEVNVRGDFKFIPEQYFLGSIEQRTDLLMGLMDTDGTVLKNGRISFTSNSYSLCNGVMSLVRSLGGVASTRKSSKKAYSVEVRINKIIFMLPRNIERQNLKKTKADKVAIVSIEKIKTVPSQCIAVDNYDREYVTDDYTRTHNTGVRGAKEMGQRPALAIFDDIVSDTDAESPTIIGTIENTVYKAVSKALHPTRQKMVWLGTPFNESDPLYRAVESGAWNVACFPIAEDFDSTTTKDTFVGSWEERFTFEYVKREYDEAMKTGRPQDFYQELMLRISSDEERLIPESNIVWFDDRDYILKNRSDYNWYIFTDAATSENKKADFSVILVFAVNNNGDIMLVDGWHGRVLFNVFLNKLFEYSRVYEENLMGVGVENSSTQKGFISVIQTKQIRENTYFNLLSNKTEPGLYPIGDKFQRFLIVQPRFAAHKIWLPRQLKNHPTILELLNELKGVSRTNTNPKKLGKARHDDVLDAVSQIGMIDIMIPSVGTGKLAKVEDDAVWYNDVKDEEELDSYSI